MAATGPARAIVFLAALLLPVLAAPAAESRDVGAPAHPPALQRPADPGPRAPDPADPLAEGTGMAAPFALGPADIGWAGATAGLLAWGQYRYSAMEPAGPGDADRSELWAMDRWAAGNYSGAAATASDILLFPLMAAPLAVSGWDAWRAGAGWSGFTTEATIYLEAMAISSSLSLLVRSTQVHPRPLVYEGSDAPASVKGTGEASGSFYSGHANGSFAAATFLAYTYPLRHPEFRHKAWLWAGALGYASTVAGLRVAAGKHFPSDILAGAAAGTFFGWLLPRLHLETRDGSYGLQLRALPAGDGARSELTWRF